MRAVEKCTLQNDGEEHLENLKEKFKERNYPTELVEEQFRKSRKKERKQLINQVRNEEGGDDRVRLISTHTHQPTHKQVGQRVQALAEEK